MQQKESLMTRVFILKTLSTQISITENLLECLVRHYNEQGRF